MVDLFIILSFMTAGLGLLLVMTGIEFLLKD